MSGCTEPESGDDLTPMIIGAAVVTVVLVQLGRAFFVGDGVFSEALLIDSDAYMWLVRAEALAEGRSWFDHTEARINPPDGHIQHWTRPLDLLLLLGGVALSPLLGFRDGLALWGQLVSPILLIVAAWIMYRLSRLLIPQREALLSAAVFTLHPMILLTFAWGRPDHHSLLTLGQVVFLYCFLRFFLKSHQNHWKWAFCTGAVGALAIWINVEALSFVLMGFSVLGLWWLWGRRDLLLCNVAMAAGLFGGIVFAVLIERGPDFFVDYPIDTMGIAYVVLFGLTLCFWVGLAVWTKYVDEPGGMPGRIIVAIALAAAVLAALAVVTPSFFAGPFAGVDELYRQVRLQYIGEQLPALPLGRMPLVGVIGKGLALFGILLVGLVEYVRQVRAETDRARRWSWAILGIMGLIYGVLALDAIRWVAYLPAAASVGFALFGGRLLDAVERRRRKVGGNLLRPLVVGGLLWGFATIGLFVEKGAQQWSESDTPRKVSEAELSEPEYCDLRPAVAALRGRQELSPTALVLIDPDRGSELLYRSDHQILAMANHRRQPGFTLFYETMTSEDGAQSHRQLSERGVDVAMVCAPEIWPTLRRDGETVVEQLGRGKSPEGFEIWETPKETGGWWIYGINRQ